MKHGVEMVQVYIVSQKSSPLKLFAIFSLAVNLYNWKLSWLLPEHIYLFTPILVHLSEYLYELYHLISKTPQILTDQFRLLRNSW